MIIAPNRKRDGVLSLCQNDAVPSVTVEAANPMAEQLLGYDEGGLCGMDFLSLLPESLGNLVDEFLRTPEDERTCDLTGILRRTRPLALKHKDGSWISLEIRVACGETFDVHPRFEMVLHDSSVTQVLKASHQLSERLSGEGVLDKESGLPNREAFSHDLELVRFHVSSERTFASVAVMMIDNYDELLDAYSLAAVKYAVQEISRRCQQSLRGEDIVARIAPDQFGIILMDADRKAAAVALNRLRWNVAAQPIDVPHGPPIAPTVSIGFSEIEEAATEDGMFKLCENALAAAVQQGGNHIQAAVG